NARIVFNRRASLVQSSEAFPSRVVNPAASRHSSMAGMTSAKKGLVTSETIRPTAGADAGSGDRSFLRGKKAGFIDRSNRQFEREYLEKLGRIIRSIYYAVQPFFL